MSSWSFIATMKLVPSEWFQARFKRNTFNAFLCLRTSQPLELIEWRSKREIAEHSSQNMQPRGKSLYISFLPLYADVTLLAHCLPSPTLFLTTFFFQIRQDRLKVFRRCFWIQEEALAYNEAGFAQQIKESAKKFYSYSSNREVICVKHLAEL